MGAGESVIRNLDKRTARRENRIDFAAAISEFRASNNNDIDTLQENSGNVSVFVRKRPLFPHEVKEGEFDAVTGLSQKVVVHDARMQADMVNRFIDHHVFDFNHVFSETEDNDRVFEVAVSSLTSLVKEGGDSTCLMYGQTGSGKTYTMSHIYKKVAEDFFRTSPAQESVIVSFVELAGDQCYDVLNENQKLQIVTLANGDVMPFPATQVLVNGTHELLDLINMACSVRATASTGVHDHSSRTHALCRMELVNGGSMTLVDLAGSEHKIDSAQHNSDRRKESAQINSSLMKLKECIRARAKNATYIPYRQSKLTHLLKPSFDKETAKTVIIATISPSSKDTEHSLNTLRHACLMDGQENASDETRWITGGQSVRQKLLPVNVTELGKQKRKERQSQGETGWVAPPVDTHSRDGSFDRVASAMEKKKQERKKEKQRSMAEAKALSTLHKSTVDKLQLARENKGVIQRRKMMIVEQYHPKSMTSIVSKQNPNMVPRISNQTNKCHETVQPPLVNKSTIAPNKCDGKVQSCSADKSIIASIRENVWRDSTIAEDEKEEFIVDRIRAWKKKRIQESTPLKQETTSVHPNQLSSNTNQQVSSQFIIPVKMSQSFKTEDGPHVFRPSIDRHSQAKGLRETKIAAEQREREDKLRAKFSRHNSAGTDTTRQIIELEKQMNGASDPVHLYGLKKKIGLLRAEMIRMQRKTRVTHDDRIEQQEQEANPV